MKITVNNLILYLLIALYVIKATLLPYYLLN